MIIKVLGNETACNSTPNTFGGNRLVRIANLDASNSTLITHKSNSTVTVGTIRLLPRQDIVIEKASTDTIECNNNLSIVAVPIAYKN